MSFWVSVLNNKPCRMPHKYRRWIKEEWPHKAYTTWWNPAWRSRFLVYVDSNLANPNLNASLTESKVWLLLHACNVRDSKGLLILIGIGIRIGNRWHHDCEGLPDSLFIISSMLNMQTCKWRERMYFSERPNCVADFVCVCMWGGGSHLLGHIVITTAGGCGVLHPCPRQAHCQNTHVDGQ